MVKSVAIPLASALGAASAGVLLGELTPRGDLFPPGGGRHTPVGKVLNRWARPIVFFYTVLVVALTLLASAETWFVLPILIGLPVSFVLDHSAPVVKIIPNARVRYAVTFLVATCLPLAYGRGVQNADKIAAGRQFDYVLSAVDGLDIPSDAPPLKRARLLGHAGDYVFYLEPAKGSIAVEKFDGKKALRFKRFESANETAPTLSTAASSAPMPASSRLPASVPGSSASPSSSPRAQSSLANGNSRGDPRKASPAPRAPSQIRQGIGMIASTPDSLRYWRMPKSTPTPPPLHLAAYDARSGFAPARSPRHGRHGTRNGPRRHEAPCRRRHLPELDVLRLRLEKATGVPIAELAAHARGSPGPRV